MKKIITIVVWVFIALFEANAQCTTSNATSCQCANPNQVNCELLPDITVATQPLLTSGTYGVMEYAYNDLSSKKSQLRISVSTPNIGRGPLEVRTTNSYVCGTDTIIGTPPTLCPNTGVAPKQIIEQRIYQKNQNAMSYYSKPAGSMTFHPTHGHMHVDNWANFSLRTATADPNPLNWPMVTQGTKLAFCLMDYGYCSIYNQACKDTLGNTLTSSNIPNYGLGGATYSCSNVVQGISAGYLDIYYQYLDGMQMQLDTLMCNGDYWIVVEIDPLNIFKESNEKNNVVAVPFTITKQRPQPEIVVSPSQTMCSGNSVQLNASGASNYKWLANNFNATGDKITVSPATTTTYTVIGQGAGTGCIDTNYVTVQVDSSPTVSTSGSSTLCAGGSATLEANGAINYSWQPTQSLGDTSAAITSASPAVSTIYTVTGTNTSGCSATATAMVNVSTLNLTISAPSTKICSGQSAIMQAQGAGTFAWSPGGGLNSTTASTVTCAAATSTTYTVTGTDAYGCTATASMAMQVLPLPVVSFTPLLSSYHNNTVSVPLFASPAGGSFTGPGVAGTSWNPYNLLPASYSLTYKYTDINGCSNQAKATTLLTYTCTKPTGLIINNIGATSANIFWGSASTAQTFIIKYKPVTSTIWSSITVNGNPHVTSALVSSLKPNTTYQINVMTNCGIKSATSSTITFTTKGNPRLMASYDGSQSLQVVPNPSHGLCYTEFESDIAQESVIKIIDLTGKTCFNKSLQVNAGYNKLEFDLTHLSRGVYMMQMQLVNEMLVSKIIIE
ncbi:MAG: fibronectin type III domain-containing protein [Bacteroidetes bacterium]|nr:fibronectin type III domain-containing protein [Bacteroidota bacterium]